jgi:AmmeMemoRadiSam system protein A
VTALLSEDGRRELIRLARAAIEAALKGLPPPALEHVTDELRREAGAFVTLRRRRDHKLRGCVGYIEPRLPVARTVSEAAVSAATQDGRFEPVTLPELGELRLDVSVLGPTFPIRPEQIVVGRHGLVIECRGRRGLLLPQVPLEWGWDQATFLEHTCRKAGLANDAWRRSDARLSGFEAEVFGEA